MKILHKPESAVKEFTAINVFPCFHTSLTDLVLAAIMKKYLVHPHQLAPFLMGKTGWRVSRPPYYLLFSALGAIVYAIFCSEEVKIVGIHIVVAIEIRQPVVAWFSHT
ncbi:MAG: hypothetical protein ACETV1_02980, partial [Candidatus Bathyarchaeia archaeon]